MRFSIVIPTFNRIQTLQQTLEALARQTHDDFEVIVVDDGSTDHTAEMVTREFPSVRLIRQPNLGPAAARNRGIQAANGESVAFTDDDCVPPPDWLARLADGYARYPHVAGVGGYLEAPDSVLRANILAEYERSIGRDEYGARESEVLASFECPAGGTNNMSYRRAILIQAGGFDETFPHAAGEDADLKWRVCRTGAQLLYLPMPVTHLQPYTWSHFRRQQINRGRGVVHFERKHAGRPPGRARIVLRSGKRLFVLIRDLLFKPHRRLSFVRFAAGWYDCTGQWVELSRLGR
jgi:glycosyltransferase involved in cell wall biosynthesis